MIRNALNNCGAPYSVLEDGLEIAYFTGSGHPRDPMGDFSAVLGFVRDETTKKILSTVRVEFDDSAQYSGQVIVPVELKVINWDSDDDIIVTDGDFAYEIDFEWAKFDDLTRDEILSQIKI